MSSALADGFSTTEPPGKLKCVCVCVCVCLYKWKEVLFGKLYPKPVVDVQILGQTFAKGQAMFPIFNWRIIA